MDAEGNSEYMNQKEVDNLLEKSIKLRERSRVTNENLDKLKVDADDFKSEQDSKVESADKDAPALKRNK